MKNLVNDLNLNQTILLLIPSLEYNKIIVNNMKKFSGKNVCYVTLNKTSESLRELFLKNKINIKNFVFIDAISKTIKKVPDQAEGVYYVPSPGALTELSIVIEKFLRHDFHLLIFDSLTNLLIYEQKAPVAKFISSLVNKIKQSKTKAIFYSISLNGQENLIKECSMFVDKVINISKK